MPFFIVNQNGIYPIEYGSYEQACANCESGEWVFIADSMEFLEECLDSGAYHEDGCVDTF